MIHRRLGHVFGVCFAALLAAGIPTSAEADPPLEFRVEAAYVSKFLRFVAWPDAIRDAPDFQVGIVGGPEFREAMSALEGHAVGERAVRVRLVGAPDEIGGLDVLVLGPPVSRKGANRYLDAARGRPILTVGDSEGFAEAGGMIEFVLVEDTVRFEINAAAAEEAGLTVSSRLLRLARNVRRPTP